LVRGEGELLDEVRVVPPHSWRPDAKASHYVGPRATALVHLAGLVAAGWRRAAVGLLSDGQGSYESGKQNNGVKRSHVSCSVD
jgi:hypothetical protein